MPNAPLKPAIQIINGHATTTSLRIADHFGKRHANVLRAISTLERHTSPFQHRCRDSRK